MRPAHTSERSSAYQSLSERGASEREESARASERGGVRTLCSCTQYRRCVLEMHRCACYSCSRCIGCLCVHDRCTVQLLRQSRDASVGDGIRAILACIQLSLLLLVVAYMYDRATPLDRMRTRCKSRRAFLKEVVSFRKKWLTMCKGLRRAAARHGSQRARLAGTRTTHDAVPTRVCCSQQMIC